MRKYKLIFILLFVGFLFLFPVLVDAQGGGLLPNCGYIENDLYYPCEFCHLVELADNIIDFIVIDISVPLAAVAFAIAGYIYITAGGNTQKIKQAHSIFTNVAVGLVIILASWLVINVIMTTLVGDPQYLPWGQAKCIQNPVNVGNPTPIINTIPCNPSAGVTTNCCGDNIIQADNRETCEPPAVGDCGSTCNTLVPIVTGDAVQINKDNMQALLGYPAVSCDTNANADCVDAQGNAGAAKTCAELRAGVAVTVCSAGCRAGALCSADAGMTVNPNLTAALQFLATQGYGFVITSITTGEHGVNSAHYTGDAVDLSQPSVDYSAFAQVISSIPAVSSYQCEYRGARVPCTSNTIDHIHIEFSRPPI